MSAADTHVTPLWHPKHQSLSSVRAHSGGAVGLQGRQGWRSGNACGCVSCVCSVLFAIQTSVEAADSTRNGIRVSRIHVPTLPTCAWRVAKGSGVCSLSPSPAYLGIPPPG